MLGDDGNFPKYSYFRLLNSDVYVCFECVSCNLYSEMFLDIIQVSSRADVVFTVCMSTKQTFHYNCFNVFVISYDCFSCDLKCSANSTTIINSEINDVKNDEKYTTQNHLYKI